MKYTSQEKPCIIYKGKRQTPIKLKMYKIINYRNNMFDNESYDCIFTNK